MTLEEMKRAALDAVLPKAQVPQEFKDQMAANQAPYAPKDQWDRGQEPGLNELTGVDVLREPKEAAMNAVGPGNLQQLIDALVPTDVGLGSMQGGMAAAGVIKPKTPMKKLTAQPPMKEWDKDYISEMTKQKLDETPKWKQKMGR